ncbi:putative peroxisomal amine oxidase (copper-containing) [Fusarium proliferatum ET1]|uniref:Amine oxidase n=1 Tax=Fusarium proliferatum (strain ET1) TaxID=1227346 RepID=A0A1L7WA61_FUSPR|nr:putative peroxisomal amine oxidase (copper-containing) [Fusarium proliferatum ET1]CZR49497.1 probable peroxisomal amine oxidase (copper-containing) [Fusarium proliferatum ET1]
MATPVRKSSSYRETYSSSCFLHPLDPLTTEEVELAARLIREHAGPKKFKFNCITLKEPLKSEYLEFCANKNRVPPRQAYAILVMKDTSSVIQCVVSLAHNIGGVVSWEHIPDVVPMLTPEDCSFIEDIARSDETFTKACNDLGITDMSTVCIDAWSIGHDPRWGRDRHLQQGLVYWRPPPAGNQYAHPLDFYIVVDTQTREILSIDTFDCEGGERGKVPPICHNYRKELLPNMSRVNRLKPIEISQPEGVSFQLTGNRILWAGISMHIGFNYREGIVLSDIRIQDQTEHKERTVFYRISLAEMVVPYAHPGFPLNRRHAFDIGEYGLGFSTNSLKLGCDCKGSIRYLDGVLPTSEGSTSTIKNAICIHEEDNGILFKHSEPRDQSTVLCRDRKLVVSQIVTVGNYEYALYHNFTLDGTYEFKVKLTGILNTSNSKQAMPRYGTKVSDSVVAHNHQHIFSLRVDPAIDGPNNSVSQCDAVAGTVSPTTQADPLGNAFHSQTTILKEAQGVDYCHASSRTWDIINPNNINPTSGMPVSYKIVNNQCPALLARPGSIIAERAAFARHSLWVVPYRDGEFFPAGRFVPQSGGKGMNPHNNGVTDWVDDKGCIEGTDIVCYIQFGVTHFPRPEDFPIMPAEDVSVVLRANHFFSSNPALWVPQSSN